MQKISYFMLKLKKNMFFERNVKMWKNDDEPRKMSYVWVLAGVYLIYLGGKLIFEMIQGIAEALIWKYAIAIVFIVLGIFLALREWKLYKKGKTSSGATEELPESYYNNIEDSFAEEYEKENKSE